jgi:hypothetical protein
LRIALLSILVLCSAVQAAELEGVKMEDRLRLGEHELQLNGMGLRSRAFFKVYVGGLYLPQKTQSAQQALAPARKRMALAMLRDVGADSLSGSLVDGLKENTSEAEFARLKPQVDELVAVMQKIGEAKKGMTIALDFAPGAGTTVLVNGAPQGRSIPGDDFAAALLRIWLGERPVSADLKKSLLGG